MLGREHVLEAAYHCLLEQEWRTLPVEPARFHLACAVLSYQEYAALAGLPLENLAVQALFDGCAVTGLRGRTLLLYNDQSPPARQRFTLAHELGHLLLGHGVRSMREEDEADFFAAALLMPDALLTALCRRGLRLTEHFLTREFGVSRAAARRKRAALLSPPPPHPLDDRVKILFYNELIRLAPVSGGNPPPDDSWYLDPK